MALTTLGFGLFIRLGVSTPLSVIVIAEVVAALGIGATFQAPLVAYQTVLSPAQTATATALFGFIRSLSTSISVVIGSVFFQNGMSTQSEHLKRVLGTHTAQNFSVYAATSNVLAVRILPGNQQAEVKKAYASSLKNMWIMYTGISGLGLIASLFIKRKLISRERNSEAVTTSSLELE